MSLICLNIHFFVEFMQIVLDEDLEILLGIVRVDPWEEELQKLFLYSN
jgi:hypothetical protein